MVSRRSLLRPALATLFGPGLLACGERTQTPPPAAPDAAQPPIAAPDAAQPATGLSSGFAPGSSERPLPVAPNPTPALKLSEGWRSLDRDAVALALSQDGRWLVTGDLGGHVAFFDLDHPEGPRFVWGELARSGRIRALACADAAPVCVAGGFDGADHSLRRYDVTALSGSAKSVGVLPGAEGSGDAGPAGAAQADTVALGLSTDGVRQVALVAAQGDSLGGRLTLTSGDAFAAVGAFALPRAAGALAVSPDGGVAFWADPDGGLLRFDFPHPAAAGAPPGEGVRIAAGPKLAHLSARRNATGDLFVHGAEGAAVQVWALPLSGEAPSAPIHRSLDAASGAVSPIRGLHRVGDHTVAVTRPPEGGLALWDADTGARLALLATDCPCERHALSADGTRAACRCATGSWVRHGPTGLTLGASPAVAPTIPTTTLPAAGGLPTAAPTERVPPGPTTPALPASGTPGAPGPSSGSAPGASGTPAE